MGMDVGSEIGTMMFMMRTFRPYSLDQQLLLPPDLRDWLPEGHLSLFISDLVDESLDLSAILAPYRNGDARGGMPYHPAMMVKLLLLAYCTGTSRMWPTGCCLLISIQTTTASRTLGSGICQRWRVCFCKR